jgi:hypothetical protein
VGARSGSRRGGGRTRVDRDVKVEKLRKSEEVKIIEM